MNVGMPFRTAKTAWRIGFMSSISSFLVMGLLLYSFYNSLPGFGKEQLFVLFFPAFFSSFSNFPVIAQALNELNLLTSDLGQLAMPCAMLIDAIQWCVIGIGVFFRQWKTLESVGAFFSFLGFLSFNIVVIRPAMIWIKKTTPDGKSVKETYIVLILVGVLVMVAAFDAVGVPYVHGPLILGLTIPDGPPLGATLEEKSELIISEFFLPLFFLVVGANTDIYTIKDWNSFIVFEVVLVVGHIAKLLGTLMVAITCKVRPRDALLLSLVMNVEGIVELVTNSRWKTQKLINEQYYTQMILTTVAVTGIVTPLIEIFYKPETVLISSKRQNEQMRTIQTTPHNSELRILVCIRNEENLHGIISLIEATNPTQSSTFCVYVIHLIELAGRAAPLLLSYKKQKKKSSSPNYTHTHHNVRGFENYSKNSGGLVTIQSYQNIAHYKNMHETICSLARDKIIPFVIIPFHENEKHLHGNQIAAAIRGLNMNIQNNAPCTVGILVERGFRQSLSTAHFSYNVAVVFLGGRDDREGLALASRMSGNPDVTVTLLRIMARLNKKTGDSNGDSFEEDEETERMLDENLLVEFKAKNASNACVVCCEISVNDTVDGFQALTTLESNYDLVIEGKRHGIISFVDENTFDFVEFEELGIVGDILASKDFCKGMALVLVMQQFGNQLKAFDGFGSSNSKDWSKGCNERSMLTC